MKNTLQALTLLTPLLFLGCGSNLSQPDNGTFKGGELVVNFSSALMKQTLISKKVADENTTVYGYKAFKIPYTTTDEEGHEVKVSGLFVIPTGLPDIVTTTLGLSMVSDDHGTIFANREAPSVIGETSGAPDGSSILLSALGGFATLQPDYIGFGDSNEHYHPFILKNSLADATVDFIRQVKIFATDNNITLNKQLFLTGYSEGGYAAMATLKKIEDEKLTDLTVTMAAPMAGPYAVKTLADAVLSQPKLGVPSFLADIGYAYAKANGEEVTSIINEPYASKLPTLFDGSLARPKIDPQLTHDTTGVTGLFSSTFIQEYFAGDTHWFKQAVVENSLHAWTPKSLVRLVHCKGDEVIPYAISELTEATMKGINSDVNVSTIPVEATLGLPIEIGHAECGLFAYKVTTGIFAQVRKTTIGY